MYAVEVTYRPNGRGVWTTRLLRLNGATRTWANRSEVEHYVSAVNATGGSARVVEV